jgi:colicin import membrane protein
MRAETLPRDGYREEGFGRPLAFALGLHLLLAVLLWLSSRITWDHSVDSAAGAATIEATLDASAADRRAVAQALQYKPEPLPPQPVAEEAPSAEETAPPPQPIPEPAPQNSPEPQQKQAQEQLPVPDNVDQAEASRDAISQEKAAKEQEEKHRQRQVDLTEQERQMEAQAERRLAQQQADEQKKLADAEKQKKLDAIRAQLAKVQKEQALAQQKLQQLADARARAAAGASANPQQYGQQPAQSPGQGGSDDGLLAQYKAAIQEKVSREWIRPDSVALGTRCVIVIKQLPGGDVISAEVQSNCPMDPAGRDSVERAVLKAQPLPYRGFEPVFSRTLIFTFVAQDR